MQDKTLDIRLMKRITAIITLYTLQTKLHIVPVAAVNNSWKNC